MSDARAARALAAAALVLWFALALLRPPLARLWGDEGTYLAMAESLALDGDLAFDARDLARAAAQTGGGVVLQQTASGFAYSKPTLYPLLAAPFVRVLGDRGMVALNALALGAALLLARRWLRGLGDAGRADLTLVTFAATAALLPYVLWRMSEAVEVSATLAGLVLVFDRGARRSSPLVGALLLGLAAAMRFTNLAVVGAVVLGALLEGRWKRAAGIGAAAGLALALATAANVALLGTPNPYRAVRATFDAATGYPVGEGAARAAESFANGAVNMTGLVPQFDARRTAYAAFYFVAGRHTGLVAYFPAALVLLATALRRPQRASAALLLGAGATVVFHLVWQPWNYFGGGTFVGNRYFLAAYPALLVALRSLPSRRTLAAVWAVALAFGASAIVSVARTRDADLLSQSHASAGLFRVLPYESTAPDLDGRRDRYWSGDFVRFVDPYAEASEWSFRLESGSPPAELLLATKRTGPAKVFIVAEKGAPEIVLEMTDWLKRREIRIGPSPSGARGVVEIRPSPAWRRHAFWWAPTTTYDARALRLAVRSPDGRPVAAQLRWLGDGSALDGGFAREVVEAIALPERVAAGSSTALRVRVRNASAQNWSSHAPLPVHLAYRLVSDAGGTPIEGPHTDLPRDVPPGGTLDATLVVRWPREPRAYRVVVDLVLEEIAWFGERTGAPLAAGRVAVE